MLKLSDFSKFTVVVGRVKRWLQDTTKIYPISCRVVTLSDSYYDIIDGCVHYETIAGSRTFVTKCLKMNAGVAVDLSALRPKGRVNSQGLESQGPCNFLAVYSAINKEVRRGNSFKNGAVNLYLDFNHPDIIEFLTFPQAHLTHARRSVYVDATLFNAENKEKRDVLIQSLAAGSIFLAKKHYNQRGERLYSNVCVTSDAWVSTTDGQRQVKDLIGVPFTAVVNGREDATQACPINDADMGYTGHSVNPGFFSTGVNPVVKVVTKEGYEQTVTLNHKFLLADGITYKEAQDLLPNDRLALNQVSTEQRTWAGVGTLDEGYLLGYFLANGNYSGNQAQFKWWYDWPAETVSGIFDRLQTVIKPVKTHHAGGRVYKNSIVEHKDYRVVSTTQFAQLAEQWGVTKEHKKAHELIERGSSDFYIGFIRGYFDGDAHVRLATTPNVRNSIQVASIEHTNVLMIQRMLLRLGIRSSIYHQPHTAGTKMMPDGHGGLKPYNCKQSWRLDISGLAYLDQYHALIGFTKPDKVEALEAIVLMDRYRHAKRMHYCRVRSIVPAGFEETFTCSIGSVQHEYSSNGFVQKQCNEILIPSRGSCTLSHFNLGMCTSPSDIEIAMEDAMSDLIDLWRSIDFCQDKSDPDFYLARDKDMQVGLGPVGLANMLAHMNIKYIDFVESLKRVNSDSEFVINSSADAVALSLYKGYVAAAKLAKEAGLERAFTVAPTASCAWDNQDAFGFVLAPEISPPICNADTKLARRESELGFIIKQLPFSVEVADLDVDYTTYDSLCEEWQKLMDGTGLAHSISYNWWSTKPFTEQELWNWFYGPLKTIYYTWPVGQTAQDKTSIRDIAASPMTQEETSFWADDKEEEEEEEAQTCEIGCVSCAE